MVEAMKGVVPVRKAMARSEAKGVGVTQSNIEPLARAIAERAFRQCENHLSSPTPTQAERDAWVDDHWECAAAELEAGLIDDAGNRIPGGDWEHGLAAYRERISSRPQPSN